MAARRQLGAFGNQPVAVAIWWVWTVVLFAGSVVATVWLFWVGAAMLWLAMVNGPGPLS